MKNWTSLALVTTIALSLVGCSATGDDDAVSTPAATTRSTAATPSPTATGVNAAGTPISITGDDRTSYANLNNSEVSRDFIKTLPGYRNDDIEYITELDAPLTETGPFYNGCPAWRPRLLKP